MGYRYEVFVSGKWYDNAVIFATAEEAQQAGDNKLWSWSQCEDVRVVESDQPANYRLDIGSGVITFIAGAA